MALASRRRAARSSLQLGGRKRWADTPRAAPRPSPARRMRKIYPDVESCRALIVDGNPSQRSLQAAMLRDMGVSDIVQTGRVADSRRLLENRVFDVVLCDYHFDGEPMTGRDLLDDLRRANLLPYATVFIMVTGEASYGMVAEAAESALDSYLLKPHNAIALEQRLIQARHRKTTLRDIFAAIEAGDFEAAGALCVARFDSRKEYWLYAARIGAELFIRSGRHEEARRLFEAVQASKAVPWARLGIARVEVETGRFSQARRTLESLIAESPEYADAHDVLGRVEVEQGNLQLALETYRNATLLTPQSVARLQKQGMLAFFMGQGAEAAEVLERSVRIGLTSKTFDAQTLVLLALTHFDARDSKAFMRNLGHLQRALDRAPDSVRLQRFMTIVAAFQALLERQVSVCIDHVHALVADIGGANFDFESATNLLAVLTRLQMTEVVLESSDRWVAKIALRFCVTKGSTELLCLAVLGREPAVTTIRTSYAEIGRMSERAMAHSVKGAHAAAIESLIAAGSETFNAKLVELAAMVLTRHGTKIDDSEGLAAKVSALKVDFCSLGTQVTLGGGAHRAAGALAIRS
jgi:CheY-like chemotaxis protein